MLRDLLLELEEVSTIQALKSWFQLKTSSMHNIDEIVFLSYVEEYIETHGLDASFDVRTFVSKDNSCILFRDIPVIFLGSNNWAPLQLVPEEQLKGLLEVWRKHLDRLLGVLDVPVYLAIVPEKDVVVRELLGVGHKNAVLNKVVEGFIAEFENKLAGATYLEDVLKSQDPRVCNYRYYDSHLLSRDYLRLFINAMQSFCLADRIDWTSIQLKADSLHGDLAEKLGFKTDGENFLFLDCAFEGAGLVEGCESFASPLRATYQVFDNPSAVLDAKIAVFGDSHSSIYSQRKLTYLFSNVFSKTEFYWDPMCVNNQNKVDSADYVFLEISERFLFNGAEAVITKG